MLVSFNPHLNPPHKGEERYFFSSLLGLFHTQPLDVTEEGPFRLRNNTLAVPDGPGLGVTLSQEKLKHLHQHFVENGPLNKYIDPANPGRMRRPPLA